MLGWCSKKPPGQKPHSWTWNFLPAKMRDCPSAQWDEDMLASASTAKLRTSRPWRPVQGATGGWLMYGLSGCLSLLLHLHGPGPPWWLIVAAAVPLLITTCSQSRAKLDYGLCNSIMWSWRINYLFTLKCQIIIFLRKCQEGFCSLLDFSKSRKHKRKSNLIKIKISWMTLYRKSLKTNDKQ